MDDELRVALLTIPLETSEDGFVVELVISLGWSVGINYVQELEAVSRDGRQHEEIKAKNSVLRVKTYLLFVALVDCV